jgi:acetoin utilization deacetylase AcuC-like enzyme
MAMAEQPVAIFHTPVHALHRPGLLGALGGWRPSRDDPQRIDSMLAALAARGLAVQTPAGPDDNTLTAVSRVHSHCYLDFLAHAHAQWTLLPGTSAEVHANVFAMRQPGAGYPRSVIGRAAFHFHDQLAPIGTHTWEAALAAAHLALSAADAVLTGTRCSYAMCRPPGHHAYADMAGGGTYLNNAAIAVEHLRTRFSRVAVIDLDVHHGNGTQDIFWQRPDVFFTSLHRNPEDYHPFFSGYAAEVGAGAGEGFTFNLPIPAGTADANYLRQFDRATARIVAYAPEALVVSLGLDAHETDPAQGLLLSDTAFAVMGRELRHLGLPTVLVQEGGYNPARVGGTLLAFLSAWVEAAP